ncbi:MAG: energy transducer TonB [Pseudomonadota bacterium]
MRARGSAHASLLLYSGTGTASIGWYAAASLVIHVLVFVIFTYLPDFAPQREFVPSVIMVNMVTMSPTGSIGTPGHPGPEKPGPKSDKPAAPEPKPAKPEVQESKPEPPAPKPAKPEPPAPKPEKVSVPEPQPHPPKAEPEKSADVISLSNEKPKIKTSLKKETFKSNQAIKNALNRIEKQVEETKPSDPLASALDRIKSKVEKTEAATAGSPSKGTAASGQASGSGGGGGTGGTGAFGIQPIDFYRSLVPNHIENNWVFNEQLVGGRTDLMSVIVIKIMQNGEISDIWFEKKSGNTYFDDSVYKAVKKSNPLPPLPKEYTRPYYELGLVFTPKGLKRS